MRTLIVSGIVVNEPQVKVSNQGTSYVEFRMVNHDSKEDFWFTCRSSHSNVVSFVKKYVKKGSRLNVIGSYNNEVYVNNQQVAVISNNLWVNDAGFANDGNANSNNDNAQKPEEKDDVDNMTSESKSPEAHQPESPKPDGGGKGKAKSVEDVPADDLPF